MCPLIPWLTVPVIRKALAEIDAHTNLRRFEGEDGTWYLHATKWDEHQVIEKARRGVDRLPSHPSFQVADKSASSRRVVAREVEVEVEVEVEDKKEVEVEVEAERAGARTGLDGPSAPANDEGNGGSPPDTGPSPAAQQLRTPTASFKKSGLEECVSRFRAGEWTLEKVSEMLRVYGHTPSEINAPEIMQLFLTPEKQAATVADDSPASDPPELELDHDYFKAATH
jgi:hypothetical protein